MAIPFLPASLIYPTFTLISTQTLENEETEKLTKLKNYVRKHWLIYNLNTATNNGAESYHSKFKARIKTRHPRIWTFMSYINEIILDVHNDIGRIRSGREISRARKTTSIRNQEHRALLKQKLCVGEFTPWQFLQSISHTVGCLSTIQHTQLSDSEDSEDDPGEQNTNTPEHLCVVCLSPRGSKYLLINYSLT